MAKEAPKLSLAAQYDDICRMVNSLINRNDEEEKLLAMVRSCEQMRVRCVAALKEVEQLKAERDSLAKKKNEQEEIVRRLRNSYAEEVKLKSKAQKDVKLLRNQLEMIKRFVLEDPTADNQPTREKVLSCIRLDKLHTVEEECSQGSMSGIEFDKSEDDESLENLLEARRESGKRKSNEVLTPRKSDPRKSTECKSPKRTRNELDHFDMIDDDVCDSVELAVGNHNHIHNRSRSEPDPRKRERKSYEAAQRNQINSDSMVQRIAGECQEEALRRGLGNYTASTPHFNRQAVTLQRTLTPNAMSGTPLKDRQHCFVVKKVFRPENCGPCGKRIGFCCNCFKCRDCRATCHIECKDKVPLPCVPFSTPTGGRSGGRLVLVADFAPKTRPMIPAIIVHCCNEIEKRGLNEAGLYRISGSEREVNELKDRILKSKVGMPNLTQVDVHVLCNVVKKFLRELDEPLVTRILWRDFVRASAQENPEEERALIMQAISELPTSNRDTLAFLMTHLKRIAVSEVTKMTASNLSKIFGPTLVGHSNPDVPVYEMYGEVKKQTEVMESLFRISEEVYSNILSSIPYSQDNRRLSVGSRLFGAGVTQKAPMTPLRERSSTTMPKQSSNLSLRPLF